MIQRIQSIYLLIVVVASGVLPFVFPLWTDTNGAAYYFTESTPFSALFLGTALLAFIGIFLYKKRQNQFVLCRLIIIFNLILLGLLVYHSLSLPGEDSSSEKGIGIFLPVISIVFLVLANRAIKKDEELVKSVDRLR